MRNLALLFLLPALTYAQPQMRIDSDGSSAFSFQTGDAQKRAEVRYPDGSVSGNYSHTYPTGESVQVTYTAGNEGYAESRQYGYGASADRSPGYRQPLRPANQAKPPALTGYGNQMQPLTDEWQLARQTTASPVSYPRRPVMTYNTEDDSYHIPEMAQQQQVTTSRPTTTTTIGYRTEKTTTTSPPQVYGRRLPATTTAPNSYLEGRNNQLYTQEAEEELSRLSANPDSLSAQQLMILAAILSAAEGGYSLGPNPLENVMQENSYNTENHPEREENEDTNIIYKTPAHPPQTARSHFPQPIVIPIILSGMQLQNSPNSVFGSSRLTAQSQSNYGSNIMEALIENITTTTTTTRRPTTTTNRYRVTEAMEEHAGMPPNTGYYFIPTTRQSTPEPESERLNDLYPHDYDVDTYRPRPRVTSAATTAEPSTTRMTTTTTTTTTTPPTTSSSSDSSTTSTTNSEPPIPVRVTSNGVARRPPVSFSNILRVPIAYFFPGAKVPYPVVPHSSKRVGQ